MDRVVKVGNLYKKYGRTIALSNVSLEIKGGEIIGLCGPNGSGKSTFLRVLVGIVKPTSGYVEVLGKRPDKLTRREIAYVSENDVLYKNMRVDETIRFLKTFYPDMDVERAFSLLEREGIEKDRKVGELSKGNRQRLKVVLAISRDPKLLLLDEPLSGIDMVSRERILNLVKEFLLLENKTAIISTHFVEGLEEIFSRVIFMSKGEVVLDEDCEELRVKHGKSVKSMYLEVFGGVK